ncbi:MAG: hypothetical protein ACLQDM_22045 [Bradyrhizobium sp.]
MKRGRRSDPGNIHELPALKTFEVSITNLSDRREQFLNHVFFAKAAGAMLPNLLVGTLAGNRKSTFSVPPVAAAPSAADQN